LIHVKAREPQHNGRIYNSIEKALADEANIKMDFMKESRKKINIKVKELEDASSTVACKSNILSDGYLGKYESLLEKK
jgi:hypothetical protein